MDRYPDYTTEDGGHPGRTIYKWRQHDRPWKLLTIEERDTSSSLLLPDDEDRFNAMWPRYDIRSFPGILTVHAAMEIIGLVYVCFDKGKSRGRQEKINEIQAALRF